MLTCSLRLSVLCDLWLAALTLTALIGIGLTGCAAANPPAVDGANSIGALAGTTGAQNGAGRGTPVGPARHDRAWPIDATQVVSNTELPLELARLAATASKQGAAKIELLTIGHSQGGVPLLAVRASSQGRERSDLRPSILLTGQQHGDEPSGAQVLLALVRHLSEGRYADDLKRFDLIIVPRLNPDGAATVQIGNAAGIDVDRDQLLLQSPEARALAILIREADPAVVVDLREQRVGPSDSADTDVFLGYAVTPDQPAFIARAAEEWFRRPLTEALVRAGHSWAWFTGARITRSGDSGEPISVLPDTAINVIGLKNIVSLAIAVRPPGHDAKSLAASEQIEEDAVAELLSSAAVHAEDLVKVRHYVREEVASHACRGEIVLDARVSPSAASPGPAQADQSGPDGPQELSQPRKAEPTWLRPRPCGYWLAAQAHEAADRLRQLGVEVEQLHSNAAVLGTQYVFSQTDGEQHNAVRLVDALVDMPAGSYYVPLSQGMANVAIAALEPDTPYGFYAHRILTRVQQLARLRSPMTRSAEVPWESPAGVAP